MSRKYWLLVLFVIPALILSACGGKTAPAQPVTVRIGYPGAPDTLNPAAAINSEAWVIFEIVYSSIYEQQLDGTYTLDLADSVTGAPDGLSYTIKIKPNVKFHDGVPLTAKDVAFSIKFYMDHPDFPYMNTYTTGFSSVEATDDQTVLLKLSEPVPNIQYQLVFLYILPEHIWGPVNNADVMKFENKDMIGSGPLKLVGYSQDEYVHLAKFADYFGPKPKIDEIVFQTFKNNDAMVQAIKTGQVDMITEMPSTAVAALKDAPNVKVVTGAPLAPDITDIIFNLVTPENCPTADGGLCTGNPALRDLNVRKALAYATDKQQLVDVVLLGMGTKGLTLIPDSLIPWYNTSIKDYVFDVAKANALLDANGYKDVTNDGIREMPDGKTKLEFRLIYPSDSQVAPRLSELLSSSWNKIGVKLDIQSKDTNAVTAVCSPVYDYDIIIWGWGSDPDPSFLLNVMTTDQIPTGMNETGYSNPIYDAMYKQQGVELNPETRKQIVWQMQQIVFDDVVYIIPFYAKAIQAYRIDTFKNWTIDKPKLALDNITTLMLIEPVKK